MKRYKRPTKEEFYEQFITLNKTNKQLSQYYGCSENVIHRWKNYYNLRKPIELVVKSYKAKSPFQEPGFVPWNKGKKGLLLSQNCKKTWFKQEDLLKRAEKNIGKPQGGHETTKWMVCSTEDLENYKNSQKKIGQRHKRISYAQYVLQQAGIEIPKGYVVYHVDGNYANNDIGNLEVISRAELCKRNHSAGILAKKGDKYGYVRISK